MIVCCELSSCHDYTAYSDHRLLIMMYRRHVAGVRRLVGSCLSCVVDLMLCRDENRALVLFGLCHGSV